MYREAIEDEKRNNPWCRSHHRGKLQTIGIEHVSMKLGGVAISLQVSICRLSDTLSKGIFNLAFLSFFLGLKPIVRYPRAEIPLRENRRLPNASNDGGSISQDSNLYTMPSVMPEDFVSTTQIYNTRSVVASLTGSRMNAPAIAITPHRKRAIVFSRSASRASLKGARPSYPAVPSSSS